MGAPIDPKRTNVKATHTVFETVDGYWPDAAPPGSIQFSGDLLMLACPGCGHLSGMTVGNPKPQRSPSWELSGSQECPTLSPSINCVGCCGWHGYLRNGVFESC